MALQNRLERIWKLASVDFKRRYYNNRLGLFWALLNPFFQIIVYYFFFVYVVKVEIENYVLFLFSGLILWMTFSEITKNGSKLFVLKRYLIEHTQVKTIDLFLGNALGVLFGLFFNVFILLAAALLMGSGLGFATILIIPYLFILFLLSTAVSILLGVIQIHIKDVLMIWDIVLLAGFWSSGVFFSLNDLPAEFAFIKYINPFILLIDGVRSVILYNQLPDMLALGMLLVYAGGLFLLSMYILKRNSHLALEKQ